MTPGAHHAQGLDHFTRGRQVVEHLDDDAQCLDDEQTEAARIVADAGAGFAAPADDPEEIAAALKRLLDGDSSVPTGKAVERYAYPKLAEEYSALVQRVVGCR